MTIYTYSNLPLDQQKDIDGVLKAIKRHLAEASHHALDARDSATEEGFQRARQLRNRALRKAEIRIDNFKYNL